MHNMENKAYAAAVEFAVSEKSEANAWQHLSEWVTAEAQSKSIGALESALIDIEIQVKRDLNLRRMPASWRSAKSVALQAASAGISLLDVTGKVRGKSAISKELKERSAPPTGAVLIDFAERVRALDVAYGNLSPADDTWAHSVLLTSRTIKALLKI